MARFIESDCSAAGVGNFLAACLAAADHGLVASRALVHHFQAVSRDALGLELGVDFRLQLGTRLGGGKQNAAHGAQTQPQHELLDHR